VKNAPIRASVITLLAALTMLLTNAHAQEPVQVGISYYPTNVINVSASIPMFTTEDVTHSARAGITYAFSGLPAVNASYVLSGPREGRTQTYVGAGVGLAFPQAPAASPSLSGHALTGVNVLITQSFNAFTEVIVAGNSFGTRMSFGVGVAYLFGGSN